MGEFWAVFWMVVVLKIPILALLGLVWWAISQQPPADEDTGDDGGSDRDPHAGAGPRSPRPPRRGPHREAEPRAPRRVRLRAGRLQRTR